MDFEVLNYLALTSFTFILLISVILLPIVEKGSVEFFLTLFSLIISVGFISYWILTKVEKLRKR